MFCLFIEELNNSTPTMNLYTDQTAKMNLERFYFLAASLVCVFYIFSGHNLLSTRSCDEFLLSYLGSAGEKCRLTSDFLSGGHKPWHVDERGGASRLPFARHDTRQQFPAAVCGRRPVE